LPIIPSNVFQPTKEVQESQPKPPRQINYYFWEMLRSFALTIVFLVIAAFIGTFTSRILQLDAITFATLRDAILYKPLPSVHIFLAALVGGTACAIALYSRYPYTWERIPYFITGGLFLVGCDLILFNVSPQHLLDFTVNLYPYREALYAQGTAAFIMLLLAPFHRKLAPIYSSPLESRSPAFNTIYELGRLVIVTLLLNSFAAYWATFKLHPLRNEPIIGYLLLGFMDLPVSLPMIAAFIAGLAVASLFYWPPTYRETEFTWYFLTIRILIVLGCIIALGLIYQTLPDPIGFFKAIIAAAGAMFLAVPIQRVFS
jgi:hypothetical protein